MKSSLVRKFMFLSVIAAVSMASSVGICEARCARTIDPIVSSDWLASALGTEGLTVLDVRSAERYLEGHIPGAINEPWEVPFSAWITMRDDLLLEVPDEADLFASLGGLGLMTDSKVVVVSEPNEGEPPHYGLAASTRVADTLIWAGVRDVAILDGGYPDWVEDGTRPVETEVPSVLPTVFDGALNLQAIVPTDYVASKLYRASILDVRDASVYFGATVEPFAPKAGHIASASSLPSPWIWETTDNALYFYKDAETLGQMAAGVIGMRGGKWREVIVYCGVGGYASSWWYVLTQVLGYKNVKYYDGSAQEWVQEHDMVPYVWQ